MGMSRIVDNTAQNMRRILKVQIVLGMDRHVVEFVQQGRTKMFSASMGVTGKSFSLPVLLISLTYPPKPPAESPNQEGLF